MPPTQSIYAQPVFPFHNLFSDVFVLTFSMFLSLPCLPFFGSCLVFTCMYTHSAQWPMPPVFGAFNMDSYGTKTLARNSASFFPQEIMRFQQIPPRDKLISYNILSQDFYHRPYRSPNKSGNAALFPTRAHAKEDPKIIQYLLNELI